MDIAVYNPKLKWPLKKEGDHMILACAYVRQQRNQLLLIAIKELNQHRRRVEAGLDGPLTLDEVSELKLYVTRLRDVPQQSGFPYEVQWPKVPESLRKNVIS